MNNVLILDQKNYKSKWYNNYTLEENDLLVCNVKPRYYFVDKVFLILKNNLCWLRLFTILLITIKFYFSIF